MKTIFGSLGVIAVLVMAIVFAALSFSPPDGASVDKTSLHAGAVSAVSPATFDASPVVRDIAVTAAYHIPIGNCPADVGREQFTVKSNRTSDGYLRRRERPRLQPLIGRQMWSPPEAAA